MMLPLRRKKGITGRKTALLYKIFVFNENSGMNIDKPDVILWAIIDSNLFKSWLQKLINMLKNNKLFSPLVS